MVLCCVFCVLCCVFALCVGLMVIINVGLLLFAHFGGSLLMILICVLVDLDFMYNIYLYISYVCIDLEHR